jgi:hypothetical protein
LRLSDDVRVWIDQTLARHVRLWLDRREPLAFLAPSAPALARIRWQVAAGRRGRLIRQTLLAQPPGERLPPLRRAWRSASRLWRIATRRVYTRRPK